jgi:hypothetical protein
MLLDFVHCNEIKYEKVVMQLEMQMPVDSLRIYFILNVH